MKISELKSQIEEIITEILSEVNDDAQKKIDTAVKNQKVKPKDLRDAADDLERKKDSTKLASVALNAGLKESDDDDDSTEEKEPTKSELKKNAGVAKIKDELAKVTKEMKDLAKEYIKAEGDKKDKIKTQLKDLTTKKKDLEKKLDKAL